MTKGPTTRSGPPLCDERPDGEDPLAVGPHQDFVVAALQRGVGVPDPGQGRQRGHRPVGEELEDLEALAAQLHLDARTGAGAARASTARG